MQRKLWDINEFDKVNLPEIIGSVDPDTFSEFNRIRVLDMPIHMPGQGWKIPENIEQFRSMIDQVAEHEGRYGDFEKDHYVYITVDQKIVEEGKTGRRPGAHSDAYVEQNGQQYDVTAENSGIIAQEEGEVSHTYICMDVFPTEFFNARFPLKNTDCDSALRTFDEIADVSEVVTYPEYAILKLDPYVVHRCAIADRTTERTFVKISISRKKYAREGNTINPYFDYDWEMKARSPHKRNHPWAT